MSKTPKSMALAMAALLAGALASNAGCMSDLMDPEQQNETADLFQAVDLGGVAPDLGNTAADLFQAADLTPPADLGTPPDLTPVADMTPPPDLTPAPDLRPSPDLAPEHIPCNGPCKAAPNADVACVNDACTIKCKAGFADCDGVYANGCETDVLNDAGNCGGCALKCPAVNSTPACTAGQCRIAMCNPGWADCDRNPANGCEIDVVSDVSNCGACGTACPALFNASRSCIKGACVIGACNLGFADCNHNVVDGCEQDINNDPANCGACNNWCSFDGMKSWACGGGVCNGECDVGMADCDGDKLTNGCEISTQWDDLNCGACRQACKAVPNGSTGCAFGTCQISSCDAGWDDCNHVANDGCEVDLNTNAANCGGCGNICQPQDGLFCSGGGCGWFCKNGETACPNKGCRNLANDLANCGGCGVVCDPLRHGQPGCVNRSCSVASCDAGWGDCDGKLANGCESNLMIDPANCGGCGKPCGQGETCVKGVCVAPPHPVVDGGVPPPDLATPPCPNLRTLQPVKGWEVIGFAGQPDANGLPVGIYKAWGESQLFTWCPARGEVALINAQSLPAREVSWLAIGDATQTDGGVWGWCGNMRYSCDPALVFSGSLPGQLGCEFICVQGYVNMLCK